MDGRIARRRTACCDVSIITSCWEDASRQTASTQWAACNYSDTTNPMTLLQPFISVSKRRRQYAYYTTCTSNARLHQSTAVYQLSLGDRFFFFFISFFSILRLFSVLLCGVAYGVYASIFCMNDKDCITCRCRQADPIKILLRKLLRRLIIGLQGRKVAAAQVVKFSRGHLVLLATSNL